MLLSDLIFKL